MPKHSHSQCNVSKAKNNHSVIIFVKLLHTRGLISLALCNEAQADTDARGIIQNADVLLK